MLPKKFLIFKQLFLRRVQVSYEVVPYKKSVIDLSNQYFNFEISWQWKNPAPCHCFGRWFQIYSLLPQKFILLFISFRIKVLDESVTLEFVWWINFKVQITSADHGQFCSVQENLYDQYNHRFHWIWLCWILQSL